LQIGYGSNKKTRHLAPNGYRAFLVNNARDLDVLLMHSGSYAAEYVLYATEPLEQIQTDEGSLTPFLLARGSRSSAAQRLWV